MLLVHSKCRQLAALTYDCEFRNVPHLSALLLQNAATLTTLSLAVSAALSENICETLQIIHFPALMHLQVKAYWCAISEIYTAAAVAALIRRHSTQLHTLSLCTVQFPEFATMCNFPHLHTLSVYEDREPLRLPSLSNLPVLTSLTLWTSEHLSHDLAFYTSLAHLDLGLGSPFPWPRSIFSSITSMDFTVRHLRSDIATLLSKVRRMSLWIDEDTVDLRCMTQVTSLCIFPKTPDIPVEAFPPYLTSLTCLGNVIKVRNVATALLERCTSLKRLQLRDLELGDARTLLELANRRQVTLVLSERFFMQEGAKVFADYPWIEVETSPVKLPWDEDDPVELLF